MAGRLAQKAAAGTLNAAAVSMTPSHNRGFRGSISGNRYFRVRINLMELDVALVSSRGRGGHIGQDPPPQQQQNERGTRPPVNQPTKRPQQEISGVNRSEAQPIPLVVVVEAVVGSA